MKENKTIKNISIIVICTFIIAIIELGIYTIFIMKDDNDGVNNNQNNYAFTTHERTEFEGYEYKYVTNSFTLFSHEAQCDEAFSGAIDKNENKIAVKDNNYQLNNLQIQNRKLIAYGTSDCPCNNEYQNCQVETKAELIYNWNLIEIKNWIKLKLLNHIDEKFIWFF